MRQFRRL
jgi:hypothetical protein